MPTFADLLAVDNAILTALQLHEAHAYHIIRERGAVADLRQRLMQAPELATTVSALPIVPHVRGAPKYAYGSATLKVCRTQLEIGVSCDDTRFKKAIDIVVLKDNPELKFGAWGPGDVLQQCRLRDIDIAIEVKASQSSNPEARGSYVKDIYALLQLRQVSIAAHADDPAHSYFVLIDRNDPIYGNWLVNSEPRMTWSGDADQSIQLRRKGLPNLTVQSLGQCGLEVSAVEPVHTKVWVKCYWMHSTGPLNNFFAFMSMNEPPQNIAPYVW